MATDFFCGPHGFEDAGYHLARAGAMNVVGRFRFEQLGVGEDDAELVVQPMEEETQFW